MTSFLPEPLPSAARERVVERLTRLYAQDALSESVFEAQLQRVYAATSLAELDAIAAALPPEHQAHETRLRAFLSGAERKIVTTVPRELKIRAHLAYVELDLTDATFQPGVTTIDVGAFMGYVQIRFPPGVRVENAGRAVIGYFSSKGPAAPEGAGVAVVRIVGWAWFGFAEGIVVGQERT